jgi:protein-disulfide isomerase
MIASSLKWLRCLALPILLTFAGPQPAGAQAGGEFTAEQILNDPNDPVGGNPKGDITIAVFTDYNCPYCKKSKPDLERAVREDGNIRLVYKEWPVLSEASAIGSKVALAARYQGKYREAHDAMMALPGGRVEAQQMVDAVREAGIDMEKLDADLKNHDAEITAMLRTIHAQGDYMGFQSTPSYIIGKYRVPTALNYEAFKKAVADARAFAKQPR